MSHRAKSLKERRVVRFLENRHVRVGVEAPTGAIVSCAWKRGGVDLFQQVRGGIPGYRAGLRIYDERDRRWYEDGETPCVAERFSCRGGVCTVTRRYAGAPFTVLLRLRLDEAALHWEVEVAKRDGDVADRSLRVHFRWPLIAGWDVWAPCNWGERTFDGMTPFEFMYAQVPYVSEQEVILPMVSHFSRALDVGFSVVEPIDANVPAAKFVFNNGDRCFNWGSMLKDARDAPVLETVNYYIGLVGDRPMTTQVMLFFHEGDWRPGLGRVYRRWQPHFDPFNETIHDRAGVFECGSVANADNLGRLKALGVRTLEVHGHFQDYGDYFPTGSDSWWTIDAKEALRRVLLDESGMRSGSVATDRTDLAVNAWLAAHTEDDLRATLVKHFGDTWRTASLTRRRDDIRNRLQRLADAGISCHWYFNYTDGFRALAEDRWPDAIARGETGDPIPSGWYMCHAMNADPRFSFGRHMLATARKVFAAYPMLDGLFLDCFRHYEIDFAHDDGATVVNGKPCYSMNHSYDDIERRLKTRLLLGRNLTSFANKPMSIRSMRYCDGQLLEGNGDLYEEKFFWASIAMPLFFMWTRHDVSLDEFLRRAVLHGCFPRDAEPTPSTLALYRRYLPLFEAFRRRVFCFEADPMRVPVGSRGKLYTLPDGSYVAGIVNLHVGDDDRVRWARRPHALFRVERGHRVERVGMMRPGDSEFRDTRFKFDGTFIAVPLDGYTNCAVVKLFATGSSRRRIGRERFGDRPRMCGDPESGFEDVSDR